MKRIRRPSPAMVVALLALFVAMAGTAYAALKLPKNSVGSKQLKKNSVTAVKVKDNSITGAKVKNASLTGEDIDLGKLGTVPAAQTAQTAQSANSLAPMEATHFIGQIGEPLFENGAVNFGTQKTVEFQRAGFYKDHDGIVHLQGTIETGSGPLIFSLPSGFRPAAKGSLIALVACLNFKNPCPKESGSDEESVATVTITGTGTNEEGSPVTYNGGVLGPVEVLISLDGVSFRAES